MASVYFQNVNGLRTKLHQLRTEGCTHSYDIIIMVETNLQDDVCDSELGLINHNIFRCDRSLTVSNKESGGGILVAVSKHYNASVLSSSSDGDYEALFISISQPQLTSCIIGVAYIAPQKPSSTYLKFCNQVASTIFTANPSDIYLFGDFNQPNTNWSLPLPASVPLSSQHLVDMADTFLLKQINEIPNSNGVILDLIFSTKHCLGVTGAIDALIPEENHHPALCLDITLDPNSYQHSVRARVPDFRRSNLPAIKNALSMTDFVSIEAIADVDEAFSCLVNTIKKIVLENTPHKQPGTFHYPIWFSRELKNTISKKKAAHKAFKTSQSLSAYQRFSYLRRQCSILSRTCYANYIAHVDSVFPSNPRAMWSHINNLKKRSASPSTMTYDGEKATTSQEICNMLAKYFSSVFAPATSNDFHLNFDTSVGISSCVLQDVDVLKKLSNLDGSKGCGPDGIPPSVLRHCAELLTPSLTRLFNLSLKSGVFPSILKEGFIVPLPKSNETSRAEDFRPIVILSSLAKVFEGLVLDQLVPAFKHVIANDQHGFMPGRSTLTNLLTLQHFILEAFSRGHQVDAVYTDFEKAFDKLNHFLMVAKIHANGINSPLLHWFLSYLIGRILFVKFNACLSGPIRATSGVPQGSLMGPFLFLLFINDLIHLLQGHSLFFADDGKIFMEISSVLDCNFLQNLLDIMVAWTEDNLMSLNSNKCKVISFHRTSEPILFEYTINSVIVQRCTIIKDLGVILSHDLSPTDHINAICSKANKTMGLLFRLSRDPFSIQTLRLFYCCFVRQILEYCSTVWSPFYLVQSERLQAIQRRFVRLVGTRLGYQYLDVPILEVEQDLKLAPLSSRRDVADLCFLYKLLTGVIDSPRLLALIEFRVPSQTRSQILFNKRALSTNYQLHAPIPRLMRLGNVIAGQVDFFAGTSIECFKKTALRILCEQM